MRQENLTAIKGGLNRLRTKGAALKDSLYELLNGYVTLEKTVKVRPGTFRDYTLPAGTIGLTASDGTFNVFASELVEDLPDDFTLYVLHSPDPGDPALTEIHFAERFMGALYVVAEFSDGGVYHYWLQAADTWAANTIYELGELVQPSTADGFVYAATRLDDPYPAWTANAPREVGDRIEPRVFNNLYFEVEHADGSNPRSGTIEPSWDVEPGDIVVEYLDGSAIEGGTATPPREDLQIRLREDLALRYNARNRFRERTITIQQQPPDSGTTSDSSGSSTIHGWEPGKLYQPGDIVRANFSGDVTQTAIGNASFESGDTGWSKEGSGWEIAEDNGSFEGDWRAAFLGAGLFVGQGSSGTKFDFSLFGETWTASTDDNRGTTIAYSADRKEFISIRSFDGGRYSKSTNADDWDTEEETDGDDLTGAARTLERFDELGIYVLGVEGQEILTSPDGVTWTKQHDNDTTGQFDEFVYASSLGIILAYTNDERLYQSTDGETWTEIINSTVPGSVAALVWAPDFGASGQFVMLSGTDSYVSDDGETWSSANSFGSDSTRGRDATTYDAENQRVVTGLQSGPPHIAYSDDGINWTTVTGVSTELLTYGDGILVASIYASYATSTSTDGGETWTSQTRTDLSTLQEQIFAPGAVFTDDGVATLTNDVKADVVAGQTMTAKAYVKSLQAGVGGRVGLVWYDASNNILSESFADDYITGVSTTWRRSVVTATAPQDADSVSVVLEANGKAEFDYVTWDHTFTAAVPCTLFSAIQTEAGFSASVEPDWPTSIGAYVNDNEVTWEAVEGNCITWRAYPILVSGATEPTFPAEPGAFVPDNTIAWEATSRRVDDENCPNSKIVAIAASKIFAADDDIVAYSATVNPLDWTTRNDAGFIPFGLNTYGSQPVSALALYRSNLVVFNNKAFQIWQVDEDPVNFAILDAVPIGCPFAKSPQAVSNDLVFLTQEGIRSMGIAGASTNLQAGSFGKQIDPLVKAAIKEGETPISLYYPGTGQYWLFFGSEAFVLTMNGGKNDMSWSRYVFPSDVEYWTLKDGELTLRSGEKIWRVSEEALLDDETGEGSERAGSEFVGKLWWPYLDFGNLGITKELIGFDTVAEGEYSIAFGYNQRDLNIATDSYTLTDGDTVPGDIVPFPVSAPSLQPRIEFTADQEWEWSALTLYLQDFRMTS